MTSVELKTQKVGIILWDDQHGRFTLHTADGRKMLGLENVMIPFDLTKKLREGEVVFGGVERLSVSTDHRPFINQKAEEEAEKLADKYGFNYVRVEEDKKTLEGPFDTYLLSFYVERTP